MHVSLLYYACVLIYDAYVLTLLCVCPNEYILVSVQASKEPADAEQPANNKTGKHAKAGPTKKRPRKATSNKKSVEHAKEPTAAKETAEAGPKAETAEAPAPIVSVQTTTEPADAESLANKKKKKVRMCPYSIMRVSLLYKACVLINDACVLTLLGMCPH